MDKIKEKAIIFYRKILVQAQQLGPKGECLSECKGCLAYDVPNWRCDKNKLGVSHVEREKYHYKMVSLRRFPIII